ncbi:MAG: Hsp70 family protein, partial [Gemmatimonadota bacterium]
VDIHVLQGERQMAADNKTIGKFNLTGIPPAPRGVPQIEVTFDIDANGILNVSAKDKATGKEQKIRIEASSGLEESEIEQMVKDAEAHASEDKERREAVETRNRLDSLIYQTEKNLEDWKDKLDEQGREEIESKLERGREALKQGDMGEIRSATEAIQATVQQAAQQIYAAAGMGEQAPGAPGTDGGPADVDAEEADADEDVVEADYEIVEEPEST